MTINPRESASSASKTTRQSSTDFWKKLQATADLWKDTLTEGTLRIWKDMLNYCSEDEARAALDEWNYHGLPRMPSPTEILQFVADAREKYTLETTGCSTECKRRHGLGYNENDVRALLKLRMADAGKPWTSEQWEQALTQIDSLRPGGTPSFRKSEDGSVAPLFS